jgi:hypothetical protein
MMADREYRRQGLITVIERQRLDEWRGYLVDEAVSVDGEAELLVELEQRLHLVHRDCTLRFQFSSN